MGAVTLNKPIVGMAPDVATGGYWLVAADGGIFSFDAPFYGSTGAILLDKPIYGMEANGQGTGYRFVASDGGIFDFGSSVFFGSAVPSGGVTTLPSTGPTTPTPTPAPTPAPPTGTLTVSWGSDGAMGCGADPSYPGCPNLIAVEGTGWAPNTTYDLTITGPDLTGAAGNTATTDASGTIVSTNGNCQRSSNPAVQRDGVQVIQHPGVHVIPHF